MSWSSFFIGVGAGVGGIAVLALIGWGLVSSYRDLKAEAASRREGDS